MDLTPTLIGASSSHDGRHGDVRSTLPLLALVIAIQLTLALILVFSAS